MTAVTFTAKQIRPLLQSISKPVLSGEALSVGEAVYIKSDAKAWLADADVAATAQVRGIVTAIGAYGKLDGVAGDMVDVTFYGPISGWSGMTPGAEFFASVTPGEVEDTAPAGASSDFRWIIGFALEAGILFVSPYTDDPAAQ